MEIEKEVKKNIPNIVEAIKRTGTAQIQTSKNGLTVVSIKKQAINTN